MFQNVCKDTKIFENVCKLSRKTYHFLQTPLYKRCIGRFTRR